MVAIFGTRVVQPCAQAHRVLFSMTGAPISIAFILWVTLIYVLHELFRQYIVNSKFFRRKHVSVSSTRSKQYKQMLITLMNALHVAPTLVHSGPSWQCSFK